MKLVKIKNKYMFRPKKGQEKDYEPEGVHIYAVETDKNTKETWAVRLTHVYEPVKEKRIKKGQIIVMKFPNITFPSGVTNKRTTKDIDGNPLDLKKVKAVNVSPNTTTYIPKAQADKIKSFSKEEKPDKKRKHR